MTVVITERPAPAFMAEMDDNDEQESQELLPSLLAVSVGDKATMKEAVNDLMNLAGTTPKLVFKDGEIVLPPERPDVYQKFKVCNFSRLKVIVNAEKQRARQEDTRQKRGYVWLDVDPIAILLNKYIIQSCHTLNSGENYRIGNFAHLYNPYMGCIFAGKTHPTKDELIVARTNYEQYRPTRVKGLPLKIRKHEAVANVCLMVDPTTQGTYLVIGRLYDSARMENPWNQRIITYLKKRCERFGLGLAVTLKSWTTYNEKKREGTVPVTNRFLSNLYLRTPGFDSPFYYNERGVIPACYSDESMGYRQEVTSGQFLMDVNAGVLVSHKEQLFPTVKHLGIRDSTPNFTYAR